MLKVAFILPSLANKGPIIVVRDLCIEYILYGITCKVYYFDDIVEIDMPCEVEKISFWKNINFEQFDIIHSHMYRPDAYVFIHKPLKKIKVKFVTTMHQHLSEQLPYDFSYLKSFIIIKSWLLFLTRFNLIVTLNEYHNKYYKKHFQGKTIVIFNGRNLNENLDIEEVDKEKIFLLKSTYRIIGGIAYITKRKGYKQIIEALQVLSNYAIIIVGDGPELENLKRLAKEFHVDKRCLWIGNRLEAYRYLKYFDCFVMCSYTEGFPLALIEASAHKLPVICSNIPIFRCFFSPNEVGFFDLDNINSMILAIENVYANRNIYSLNIYSYYKLNLTRNIMANNYMKSYIGISTTNK
ncbi:N-acetyl-alpha-D-glucosaminyl L-malate synthase [termite gut metagenome]|uniref:N-acetyl-alpha-D-glucosaminyl L-malate synthase n=1 Tax=termite gut metagenome TaxID=433724 RepID=A0A5J4RXR4_9ZZZZ